MSNTVLKKQREKSRKLSNIMQNKALYVMVLPALVFFALFNYWPMYGVQIAFRNFSFANGITGSKWVGMKWFNFFFKANQFPVIVRNTLLLSLYDLAAGFPFPILLALIMHNVPSKRFRRVTQTATYMPHFISVVVLVGMMSCMFSVNSGWFSTIVRALGGTPVQLMGEAKYFRHVYVWSGVWQNMGWNSIIYMAALSGIDPTLYEAGRVDGASRWQMLWRITLPCLAPTICIMLILQCGRLMSLGYEKIYLMQNDLNIAASEVISTYVYKSGLINAEYSFSTAVGLSQSIVSFVLVAIVNIVARRVSETSLW